MKKLGFSTMNKLCSICLAAAFYIHFMVSVFLSLENHNIQIRKIMIKKQELPPCPKQTSATLFYFHYFKCNPMIF